MVPDIINNFQKSSWMRLIIIVLFACLFPIVSFSDDITLRTQRLLQALGFDIGVADGIYGQKTELALQRFYKNRNEEFDGVLSENELSKLAAVFF